MGEFDESGTGSHRIEWQHLSMAGGQCSKLQRGKQILLFEIGVVDQNIVNGDARGETIEQIGDRVPSDDRLPVADSRAEGKYLSGADST